MLGAKVKHRREPQRGIGEIKFKQEVAGQPCAFVGWHNEPGVLKQHPENDLEIITPLWERLRDRRSGNAEVNRFLLRVLGRWFEAQNSLTGELSNQPFQMLPHQVIVTNRVINSRSEDRRWLIADDVGLGKTIEAGMIMEVLRKRSTSSKFRCLVIAPAGLLSQWEEEMLDRFGRRFRKLEKDVNALQHDSLLLASIDRLKRANYATALREVGPWDLIIVDEAHHLASEKNIGRYKLVKELVGKRLSEGGKARNVLFLTATPHTGNVEHFASMLALLQSDLFRSPQDVAAPDGRLNQVMLRNRKADVQDAKGNRIFCGVQSQVVRCVPTAAEVAFFEALTKYIRTGYGIADRLKGEDRQGADAVSFVMTTFRKLACSSSAAIRGAIAKRHEFLAGAEYPSAEAEDVDERYQGEDDERRVAAAAVRPEKKSGRGKKRKSYLDNELQQLAQLLSQLDALGKQDSKQAKFGEWLKRLPSHEKVLVFTEYRETQSALHKMIADAFSDEATALINGSMNLDARRSVVRRFNDDARLRFLISTEAGGEGLNMQRACSTVVNYDLPWNPIRLQQRIGRVYRYGQTKQVQVFNFKLHHDNSDAFVDVRVEELLRGKIREIAEAYAKVQKEDVEDVEGDVLGVVVENFDVEKLYDDAMRRGLESVKTAILKDSAALEEVLKDPAGTLELFRGLRRFNLSDYETVKSRITDAQLGFFLRQYLAETVSEKLLREGQDGLLSFPTPQVLREYADRILKEDPTEARGTLPERVERATVSKQKAATVQGSRLLRFGDLAFDAMIRHCQDASFSDGAAALSLPAEALGWSAGMCGACVVFDLRIVRQSDRAASVLRTELVTYVATKGEEPVVNDRLFDALLQAHPAGQEVDSEELKRLYERAQTQAEALLAQLRGKVEAELGTAEGLIPVLDDFAVAWIVAV